MGNSDYVQVVNVQLERKDGGYWVVSSKELPGLLLSGKLLKKLIGDIPNAIKILFKLNYEMDVEVKMSSEHPRTASSHEPIDKMPETWVAYSAPSKECHA